MPRKRSAKIPRGRGTLTHRFTTTLNSMLPFDILEEIFAIGLSWETYQPELLTWTHVCRDWRYAALSSPRLWTNIDIYLTGLTRLFVERSATQPLYLTSSGNAPKCADVLKQVASRVKSIDVDLISTDFGSLMEILGPNLPCVDKLRLEVYDRTNESTTISPSPGIKHITLINVSISPWSQCACLRELTFLNLTRPEQITMTELVMILAGAACLETLQLMDLRLQSNFFSSKGQPATLPNLCELHISVDDRDILDILRHLSLPPKAHISIDCFKHDTGFNVLSSIKSIMMEKTIVLHYVRLDWERIQFFDRLSARRPIILVSWRGRYRFPGDLSNLSTLQYVTSLSLGYLGFGTMGTTFWEDFCVVLHQLHNLKNLYVCFHPPGKLLSVLSNTPDAESWYLPQASIPCPHLQLISLRPPRGHRVKCFATILKLVQRRHDASIPLRNIELARPSVQLEAYRGELEKVVEVVVLPCDWELGIGRKEMRL